MEIDTNKLREHVQAKLGHVMSHVTSDALDAICKFIREDGADPEATFKAVVAAVRAAQRGEDWREKLLVDLDAALPQEVSL